VGDGDHPCTVSTRLSSTVSKKSQAGDDRRIALRENEAAGRLAAANMTAKARHERALKAVQARERKRRAAKAK